MAIFCKSSVQQLNSTPWRQRPRSLDSLSGRMYAELRILLPEVDTDEESARISDIHCSLEQRIEQSRQFLAQTIQYPKVSLDASVLRWIENEALEVCECAISHRSEVQAEISDLSKTTRDLTCTVLQECMDLGIRERPSTHSSSLVPLSQASESMSLCSNTSMHHKRVEEWRLAKARKKEEDKANELAEKKRMQQTQHLADQERKARKHIINEYKAQKREEIESETRAAVESHLAEIKLRREQYLSLGVGERNRERETKFLERKRTKPKPTRPLMCRKPSSCKPSKLYHPTKSSLYRSSGDCRSTSILSETASTSAPLVFTPYLSRYSMTQL